MRAGIAYGNSRDAYELGRQVGGDALRRGGISAADLVLAFVQRDTDATAFYSGLRSAVGADAPIIGGSAIGIITNDQISYDGMPAGVAILQMDSGEFRYATASGIDRSEYEAGSRLGEQLAGSMAAKLLLMFYDSIKTPATPASPPAMNASPPLIAGIESALPLDIPIIGAGLLGDMDFSATIQFDGSGVQQQAVVGMLLGGTIAPYMTITHGCSLMDGVYHQITRMDGPVIMEINGRPAAAVVDEMYGGTSWREQLPVRRLTIGVNHGDRFSDFQEDQYVARLIVGEAPGGGIVLFEPDLEAGTEFQFLLRDGGMMITSARRNATALMAKIQAAGHTPRFALYIDCAGRCAAMSNTLTEEAAEIQAVMNQHQVPLLGFYSGVEVAPLIGRSRGLDWTGVLLILAEA
ncbi:FIST C-terminal domain-containing protein [Oscillochloris sp. ZM17-4]|uniref:FIST signal transduction protein n=1 Tax=Oscillochloris sp. ZM17-4 TaxID=2866714 RepID=UPI001C72BEC9|nr:FIST N-terminal domain-containing protein [Oscillochloris sp. ZM17-4]MBX0329850.1 FIST C-terminal domain-containing protein [Oscillochloris sp. ZM17-4]